MICTVHVELRDDILDPEGKAILHALHSLGYDEVSDARVGKVIQLQISGDNRDDLAPRVEEMCKQLLANPVIENYEIEWPA